MKAFYCNIEGQVVGPVSGVEVREAARARIVTPRTRISASREGGWRPARDVQNLFDAQGHALPHRPGKHVARWHVRSSTVQAGPFTLGELLSRVCNGRLTGGVLVRRSDASQWVPLGTVSKFLEHLLKNQPTTGRTADALPPRNAMAAAKRTEAGISDSEIMSVLGPASPPNATLDRSDMDNADSSWQPSQDCGGEVASSNDEDLARTSPTTTASSEMLELRMRHRPFLGPSVVYVLRLEPELLTVRPTTDQGEANSIVLTRSQAVACVRLPLHPGRIVLTAPGREKLVLEYRQTNEYLSIRELLAKWLDGRPWRSLAARDNQTHERKRAQGKQQLGLAKFMAGINCCFLPLVACMQWSGDQDTALFNLVLMAPVTTGFLGILREKTWAAYLLTATIGLVFIIEIGVTATSLLSAFGNPLVRLNPWGLLFIIVRLGVLWAFLCTFNGAAEYLRTR